MKKTRNAFWQAKPGYKKEKILIDPRIAIAQHIGWERSYNNYTEFSVPEPDNFNRAVIAVQPIDCLIASNQVFYLDKYRDGWVSVYYINPSDSINFVRWLRDQDYYASWHHTSPQSWRTPKLMEDIELNYR